MQQSTQRAIPAPWSPFGALPLPLRARGRQEALARGLIRLEALREEMIAKAIAELDALQGDPDLEPTNGAGFSPDQRFWAKGGDDGEREAAQGFTNGDADDEPDDHSEDDDPAEASDHGEDDGTAEDEPDYEPSLSGFDRGLERDHHPLHGSLDEREEDDPGGCEHDGREPELAW